MFRVGDYVQMIRCPEYTGLVLKVGGGGSDVWLVDFIAKKGYTRIGFLVLKKMFMRIGYKKAFWFRPETNKLGWHILKGK